EVDRCQKTSPRPNFIVLLGNRYGWHPMPAEIPALEFEEIEKKVKDDDKKTLLNTWYRRDDNQVPPVYCLKPREIKIKPGATDTEKEKAREAEADEWINIENELRQILVSAIEDLRLKDEQKLKYIASATEQEIFSGAMQVEDAPEHVFCFFRNIKNLPQDNSARNFIDMDESGSINNEAQDKLNKLKQNLQAALPGNISEYEASWAENQITTSHLEKLCDDVYHNLSGIILKEISRLEEIDVLEKEIDDHIAFGIDRARFFIGRTKILQNIEEYAKKPSNAPLVVFGNPGSGKSALMARAFEQAQENLPQGSNTIRFIGATPGSSDIRTLLDGLCRQVSRIYNADESDIPTDYKELVEDFPKRLALATSDKPLIIFLDALDQLSDAHNARNLIWLPSELPEHVHVVVSLLPGDPLETLKNKLSQEMRIELGPMADDEVEKLLDLWLNDAGRTLQKSQREEVIGKYQYTKLVLYLQLAFEYARQWHSYTKDFEINPDIEGLIQGLFTRLSDDANHGEILVSRSLGYIAAAKNGLSEDELLDLLSIDREIMEDFLRRSPKSPKVDHLPVVIWSRLYFDLEPYLIERSADNTSLMTFYHPTTIGKEVKKAFLSGETKLARHRHLSQYFGEQSLFVEKGEEKTANLRKISELPYQQTSGQLWEEIYETLTDFEFLEAKCTHTSVTTTGKGEDLKKIYSGVYELMEDYRTALDKFPHE
ncbi:MAG: ATP-binding protein, partial [Candidatus Aminicenantes bacterium]|nr:ATP-binding protein [Candidatus Aminicenantes bacterium]